MRATVTGTTTFAILYLGYLLLLNWNPGPYLIGVYCIVPLISGAITRYKARQLALASLLITGIAAAVCVVVLEVVVFPRFALATASVDVDEWLGGGSFRRFLVVPMLIFVGGAIASPSKKRD